MKIILSAFGGKMLSGDMDIPEQTQPTFKIILQNPVVVVLNRENDKIKEHPPFNTICEFEWTGKFLNGRRYYELIGIHTI